MPTSRMATSAAPTTVPASARPTASTHTASSSETPVSTPRAAADVIRDEERSDDSSQHSSYSEFVSDDEEWHVDTSLTRERTPEELAAGPRNGHSTLGMSRFFDAIASIERRALEVADRQNARKEATQAAHSTARAGGGHVA
jgi:hypothetical protein